MTFHPFEVSIPHVAYAVLGGFVVFFGMFSLFIREKLYIGEACWAFLFGVIIGPYGAGIFDPRGWGNGNEQVTNTITLEFTRVVLAIGVFAIGVELPKAYMARHWKSLFFLLVPVMTWGWFVSAGLIYALIPKLNFLSSLAVAACLTPTDPILAAAVVGGKYADKHVPAHLRHLLAAESGCNDGAAFPFLYISLYLIMDKTTARAVEDWFLTLWLYQIVLGTVWGAMLGFGFRHLMKFCERKDLIDRQSYVAQYVSLALLTIGTTTMLGSDDLLAAFSCGTAFAWDGFFNKQTEQAVFSSVIDLLFNVAAFVFVGAWTPFKQFDNPELSLSVWRLVVIAILVLVLRRLPAMIALYKWIPDVKSLREAVFSGHFGPMGIGAVFISTLAAETLASTGAAPDSQTGILTESIQPIVAFMVVTSIIIHGLSIPFFSLGRRVHSVSRTWSRHVNDADAPEWTTHTRAVMRGEDIVINRDAADHHHAPVDAMERGELGSGSGSGSDEKSATAGEATPPRRDEESDETKEGSPVEERYKAENAPDGDDILQEWKEGPHRVIERRAGPGEEVRAFIRSVFCLFACVCVCASRADDGVVAGRGRGAEERLRAERRRAHHARVPREGRAPRRARLFGRARARGEQD
ncbi:Na+/H+ antiporter [Heterobasidion irregulare TC 32-1]|uniref:Na+/H+ antiporter n=1 Tax=Heterobasidion irregulare (strain TC 32-1) TaxID=747525 RepID=W4K6J1_HETIT|nr:Na+/H+ antiporter [Heterobasidion irregulare TC 32-1]ETW81447.1 Na+/H+ antiporter [Heterobasidion irregulare TC 32-1]